LLLLVLLLAELVTLLSMGRFLAWHIVIGVLLVPPVLAKVGVTGWRLVHYYAGSEDYRRAGAPPLLLRLLGPLVVLSTLAVLGSGGLLVYLGATRSRTPLVTLLGHSVDWVTLHQVSFAAFAVSVGLHVLGRLVPALRLVRPRPGPARASRPPPGATRRCRRCRHAATATSAGTNRTSRQRAPRVAGGAARVMALIFAMAVAGGAAFFVLGAAGSWRHQQVDVELAPPGR
jgi:hypothetical protein